MDCLVANRIPLLLFFLGFPFVLIPWVGRWLRIPNTLIHEMSHALVALMFRGEVLEIQLKPDSAGLAKTKGSGFISFLIALAGYPVAAVFSALSVRWAMNGNGQLVFYALMIASLVALMLWLRDGVSIAIGVLLTAGSFCLVWFGSSSWIGSIAYCISGCLTASSIITSWIVMRMSFINSAKSGDAAILKQLSGIPAWFWGAFFMFFTLITFLFSLKYIPCFSSVYIWLYNCIWQVI